MRASVFAAALVLAQVSISHAQSDPRCSQISGLGDQINQHMAQLIEGYPGTVSYFGVSGFMLSQASPESLKGAVLQIGTSMIGCYALIDTASCDYVAGELVALFVAYGGMCIADSLVQCGVCSPS